ncbi:MULTISPECIES: phosphotransferase [unclassified Brenneria]|uniref:phosphotransferase n=1 Tax=unclassified Brenneria TaxID=2634434 RepID=UPI0029C3088C|nr:MULTISPECIES: phosphotransferase [unclassified Brenneria]MDX5627599.1 phosphotransferase [Brenneria sp. L3-3Z]MDX5695310.1 phosphotransferase [Brenneria sp. L4-2C]
MAIDSDDIDIAADDSGLTTGFISMSDDEALQLARAHFGIEGRVRRLATEKDDTFRLTDTHGRQYILKVANPAEPADEIQLQTALLNFLRQTDDRLPVPAPIADVQDNMMVRITDAAGQRRYARLLTYLAGTPLDSVEASPRQREKVGEALARLRLAMARFEHPAARRTLLWDVKNLANLRPLLASVENKQQQQLLERGMARFLHLSERIRSLPCQVLHNDFSRSNIIVDAGRPDFVTGIIDFGDTVYTAVAIDVATALLNQLPRDAAANPPDDLFADGRDLLRGYLRLAPLSREELALLPHLVMGRAIARALITQWRARRFPDNARYVLRNTEPGWGQLAWLLARSSDELSTTFMSMIPFSGEHHD